MNNPSSLKNDEKEKAQSLIKEIETFKLDVTFAPLNGFKELYNH